MPDAVRKPLAAKELKERKRFSPRLAQRGEGRGEESVTDSRFSLCSLHSLSAKLELQTLLFCAYLRRFRLASRFARCVWPVFQSAF